MKLFEIILLSAISSMIVSTHIYAGWVDGNSLLEAYEGTKADDLGYRSGYFDGYVKGVADLSAGVLWCPHKNVKGGQLPKIVGNYLEAHPEVLHKGADTLVVDALKKPFPCKK